MFRTVLDTNTLVAAIINQKGYPAQILSAWQMGIIEIVVSPAIMREYRRVLFFPEVRASGQTSEAEILNLLSTLDGNAILVPGALDLRVIAKDPTDDKFLWRQLREKRTISSQRNKRGRNLKFTKASAL